HSSGAANWRSPRCRVSALPDFHRPLNMSWHHPDLYFFLCLLTGLAASLAIIYECILKFCRRKPPLVEPRCSIREIVPGLARIAVLANTSNDAVRRDWARIETAARSLGVQSQLLDLRESDALGPTFDDASARRADALVVVIDAITQANQQRIVDLAMKHRLPAIYSSREFVNAGGLISYGVSYPDLYRRAATYVDKILKGTKPADLPVVQPTKFELVINLQTAKALGLQISPMLLTRADEVIE